MKALVYGLGALLLNVSCTTQGSTIGQDGPNPSGISTTSTEVATYNDKGLSCEGPTDSGTHTFEDGRVVYFGRGAVSGDAPQSLAKMTAVNRARAELQKLLMTLVADFLKSNLVIRMSPDDDMQWISLLTQKATDSILQSLKRCIDDKAEIECLIKPDKAFSIVMADKLCVENTLDAERRKLSGHDGAY